MPLGAMLGLLMLAAMPLVHLSASVSDGEPVLAVYPPWTDAAAASEAAGGRQIGPQLRRFAVLSQSDREGFAAALRREGAWLVLSADRLAALCAPPPEGS